MKKSKLMNSATFQGQIPRYAIRVPRILAVRRTTTSALTEMHESPGLANL
jgi:hypothetical protein